MSHDKRIKEFLNSEIELAKDFGDQLLFLDTFLRHGLQANYTLWEIAYEKHKLKKIVRLLNIIHKFECDYPQAVLDISKSRGIVNNGNPSHPKCQDSTPSEAAK